MKHPASEIMTSKLMTVHFEAPVSEAYELMKKCKIRHLPIVDDDGAVVGLMSDRDVQRAMKPKKNAASIEDLSFEFDPSHEAKDFMSWPVRAVEQHESVIEVAQRMLDEKVSAFLVFTANRAPVGIVTTDDLLKLLISLLQKEPSRLNYTLTSLIDQFGVRPSLGYQ